MTRGAILASVLAAACGAGTPSSPTSVNRCAGAVLPPPPPTPTPVTPAAPAVEDLLGIDWTTVSYRSDEEAGAIWERLGLDGASWIERLAALPTERGLRVALARSLLRQGNFVCPAAPAPFACETDILAFPDLDEQDRLGDPCLRRYLAMWALGELDSVMLQAELAPELIALAGLPPPEDDLNRAALMRVSDPALKLMTLEAAERAGNDLLADEMVAGLPADSLEIAARHLHIDGAILQLSAESPQRLYLDALVDPDLRPETRRHVAAELGLFASSFEPGDPDLPVITAALEHAMATAECQVVAAASHGLELITGAPHPSSLAGAATEDDHLQVLCVALQRGDEAEIEALLARIATREIVLENHYREGERTWFETRTLTRSDLVEDSIWSDLIQALPHCRRDGECPLTGRREHYRLHWKAGRKGRLLLDRLEHHKVVTSCGYED